MAKSYSGDIGKVFKVTTGYNFSEDASATCSLFVKFPDGTVHELDATISDDAAEKAAGVVRYVNDTTLSAGTYTLQAFIDAGDSTNQWYGGVATFRIYNLWS